MNTENMHNPKNRLNLGFIKYNTPSIGNSFGYGEDIYTT